MSLTKSRYVVLELDYFHGSDIIDLFCSEFDSLHASFLDAEDSVFGECVWLIDLRNEYTLDSLVDYIMACCDFCVSLDCIHLVSSIDDAFKILRGKSNAE